MKLSRNPTFTEVWEYLMENGSAVLQGPTENLASARKALSNVKSEYNQRMGNDGDYRRLASNVTDNGDGTSTILFRLLPLDRAGRAVTGQRSLNKLGFTLAEVAPSNDTTDPDEGEEPDSQDWEEVDM